jgi:hypothetical protein
MRELTISELDAVAGGQFNVGGNLTATITQSASITQMATTTASNSGAITAMVTGAGSASAAGAEAPAANVASVVQSNSISFS